MAALGDVGFGGFGSFIHLDVSGDFCWDGHCHDDGGGGGGAGILQFCSFADLGVGVGVVELFLGFRITLLGQLSFKFGGLFDLYFGVVDSGAGPVELVGVGFLLSEELLEVSLL